MHVPYLSGCFMYLRMSAVNEVGLFDEGIFMYGEETDLCRRLIEDIVPYFIPKYISIIILKRGHINLGD